MAAQVTVGQQAPAVSGVCTSCGASALRVHGYARADVKARFDLQALDCRKPLVIGCDACNSPATLWRCSSHRSSVCKPCASRYRRRVRRIAESGLARWGEQKGFLYLITVTAPGEARAHCKKGGCDGQGDGAGCVHRRCDCTPLGGVHLGDWNASHSRRWNNLRTRLRQLHPGLVYMRGVEAQDGKHRDDGKGRSALHDHAVVWSPSRISVQEVRRLAVKAGFGHECDVAGLAPGSKKAAYYVSKYVGKSTDVRAEVPWHRWKRSAPSPLAAAVGSTLRPGDVRDHYRADDSEALTEAAIRALGDTAEVLADVSTMWSPDEGCWVQLLDADGDDWRAWTPLLGSTKATYRTWSMSRDWGLTMAAVKAEAAAYARCKAPPGVTESPGAGRAAEGVVMTPLGHPPAAVT